MRLYLETGSDRNSVFRPASMEIIYRELNDGGHHGHPHSHDHHAHHHASVGGESLEHALPSVAVRADRRTLAKTRWRAQAEDGTEFGFDLARPLRHGAAVFQNGRTRYVIEQRAEPLLRVTVSDPTTAARLGWMIGNLHFPAQVRDGGIFVEADPAVRQMLEREDIAFEETEGIFQPLHAGGHHH